MTIITHKRIFDAAGKPHCLCPTTGGVETRYFWRDVNCRRCHDIGNRLKMNPKQIKEIARLRRDKIRIAELAGNSTKSRKT